MIRPDIRTRHEGSSGIFTRVIDHDHFLGRTPHDPRWTAAMAVVNERNSASDYFLDYAMPGFSKEDISITIEGDILMVSAIRKQQSDVGASKKYILREFNTDLLQRKFKLASGVMDHEITASHKNGILTLGFHGLGKLSTAEARTVAIT